MEQNLLNNTKNTQIKQQKLQCQYNKKTKYRNILVNLYINMIKNHVKRIEGKKKHENSMPYNVRTYVRTV